MFEFRCLYYVMCSFMLTHWLRLLNIGSCMAALTSCCSTLFLSTFLESLAHKPVTVHLVHEADIDYQCPICTEPLTEPYLSIECGHHLCQQCRDCLLSIGKTECPTCHEPDVLMNAVLEKYLQRVVKSLKVRCSDYKEGCEWVGEQETLKMWRERELNNSWLVQPCRSRYWAGEASESAWNCTLRSIDSEIQTWHPMLFLVSFAHRSSYRVRR